MTLLPAPVIAASATVNVPPGPLAGALASLARQLDIDIGGSDPDIARHVTRGVSGHRGPEAALRALLDGTPFTIQPAGPMTFRIVRRPPPAPPRRPIPTRSDPPAQPAPDREIVITGGKRTVPLSTYPGSAIVVSPAQDVFGPHGGGGREWLLARTAILQSTELGSGRNKIFIRGVADSSFTGPTQATAATYFGDVRVGYSGPYPNLNLYDVERVEVLEGPQGTLYGAGSIGGIIRLNPHPASLERVQAGAEIGASATRHGAPGYDAAGMINVAPVQDHLALRLVAYRSHDGGYIDDTQRDLQDVNSLTVEGGRIGARLRIDGWTLDGGYLYQESRQPDLQYATEDSGGRLTRRSALAQPFDDRYQQGRAVLTREWSNGLSFVGAYGRIRHRTEQRYDVTRPGTPLTAYDERNNIHLKTYEARLAQTRASGLGWILGVSQLVDRTAIARTFGTLAATRDLVGVTNRTKETAVFGDLTLPLSPAFALTGGARYTRARMDGEPSINPINRDFIRGRTSRRLDPEIGFTWKIAPRLTAFAEYQQGFRTGGLAVARGLGRVATYEADQIRVGEAGLRLLRIGPTGFSAVVAASVTRWTDIQADLVSRFGFPFTTNVGDGHISGLEASADWAFPGGVHATAGLFVNKSSLVDPAPEFASSGARPLPATPSISATGRLEWRRVTPVGRITLSGQARYISHSRLGVGPVLDLRYGDYVKTDLAASLARGPFELSLTVDNLLDSRANRFAIGNPFGVQFRDEFTPLRPRTVRVGIGAKY